MELLPGFRMRPPQDEDADGVAAISNEECVAFIGVPVIDADWMRGRWTAPGVDREQDFAVVESPNGELCGFLSVEAEPPFAEVFALGIVAPAFHGLGLGAAIVSETERRARRFVELADPDARVLIHAGALADEPRVSALLSSRGYREVRRFELRRVDFAGEPAPPRDIEGLSVRGFRPEEARQLYEAHVEALPTTGEKVRRRTRTSATTTSTRRTTTPGSGSAPGTGMSSPGMWAARRNPGKIPRAATLRFWACGVHIGAGVSGKRCCCRRSAPSIGAASGEPSCMSTPIRSPVRQGCTRKWA
jgi:GNAT superfamily N-acetyltransferase